MIPDAHPVLNLTGLATEASPAASCKHNYNIFLNNCRATSRLEAHA